MKLKTMYSAMLALLISSLAWLSCKKDIKNQDTNQPTSDFVIPAATPVNGSVSGVVVDEHNVPVNGAEVKIGSSTVTTDARGSFLVKNVQLDKYVSTVTINKPGYFKAVRSFSANATLNYVNIKLIPRTLAGTIDSNNPSAVTLSNGTNISLQSNSVVIKSSGAAYTGQVKVYAAYIDPTSTDMSTVVPGSLMGQDANNMYALQSTGMIAVDLESASGEALQLAGSKPASIKMPIPSSLQSKAPATIDTWSLDDRGVWIKEGTATKNGNVYEMQATHFSFWNCDVPAVSTYLSIHVQDQAGNPLINTLVSLTVPNNTTWWSTTYGFTDSLGNVAGIIPAGTELELNVFSNPYNCAGPLYTQTVGPFTSGSAITITATLASSSALTVTGTVTDCNDQPLANGTAIIYANGSVYYTGISNGSYTQDIIHCGSVDSLWVTVVDLSNGSQANSGNITVSGNTATVPSMQVCGSGGGGSQTAEFTFGIDNQGNCIVQTYLGVLTAGVPLNGNNIIGVTVYVTVPGTYSISTVTAGGIYFGATGIFTQTGTQQVQLIGFGTPAAPGSYSFTTQSGTVTGCSFTVNVGAPPASINIGPSGGNCANAIVNGTYMAGTALNGTNTITVVLDVISAGQYSIYATNNSGMSFSDSGTVTATGPTTFVLQGSGMPVNAGVETFMLTSNGMAGCSFSVNVIPGTQGIYVFEGAPGTCSGATIAGTYQAGVALLGPSNSVSLMVNVTATGPYNIFAGPINGISFSGTGVFNQTGIQPVLLTASGTPQTAGTYTFVSQTSTGGTGCIFTLDVVN
ncbi:MAG: carboxypeptidase regulatory-like domain-containing protein [Bacteroidetes bacterium]|nr:carboxypeptidase regulatory-like domain-containing protein [Bacteroidota bacterium]